MRMAWVAFPVTVERDMVMIWNIEMVSACEVLFKHQTPDNIAKAQNMWHALIKHETRKIKDKELVQMYATAMVLFIKLGTYHNKLKKGLKVGEGERCDPESGSSSPHSTEVQDADVSSKCLAEVEEHSQDEAMAGVSEKNYSLYSIITPESKSDFHMDQEHVDCAAERTLVER